jgi:hypothetical protein
VVTIARLEKGGRFLVDGEVELLYFRGRTTDLFRETQSKLPWERVVMGGSGKAERRSERSINDGTEDASSGGVAGKQSAYVASYGRPQGAVS